MAYLRPGLQIKQGTCAVSLRNALFLFLLSPESVFTPRQHNPPLLRTMPRFTLSTFVALAVISSSVYAQDPTTASSAITPLASKHFPYDNLVRSASPLLLPYIISNAPRSDSHTKPTQTGASVARSPVTTGVTRRPKTSRPSARLPLLTRSTVISGPPRQCPAIFSRSHQSILRLLSLGTPNRSHHHR